MKLGVSEPDPVCSSGVTHHTYDAAGNRISTVDANGVEADYAYDALNRLTAIVYPASPQENITYRYDEGTAGIGRLTSIVDPSGETHFRYDQRGNLVTDTRIIDGVHYETHYAYNLAGTLTRMTYPSGRVVRYDLDPLNRVVGITTQATAASPAETVAGNFTYLPFGPARHWVDGNGLATDIDYDQDYRITDIDVSDLDTIMSLSYRYNDNANITAMLDNLGVDSQQFGYDALNRLTSASGSYGDIDYTYDGVGNRLSRTIAEEGAEISEDYRYEAGSHRLESVMTTNEDGIDVRTFEHDANGNTVADSDDERQLTMIVNARNRKAAIYDDGHRIGEYEYNALGQRVAKTAKYRGRSHAHFDRGGKKHHEKRDKGRHNKGNDDRHAKHADKDDHKGKRGDYKHAKGHKQKSKDRLHHHEDHKPVTEHLQFQYDQWGNLIAESNNHGDVVREYIYLGNYRIAMVSTGLDKPKVEPKEKKEEGRHHRGSRHHRPALYFIHNDHLGTPQRVTDADQRIVWSMSQTPFGEVGVRTEGIRMPMRFPGQYADIESGFNYNYFRDYDPTLGRYIESDPIGINGGLGAFVYVSNVPKDRDDFFGLHAAAPPSIYDRGGHNSLVVTFGASGGFFIGGSIGVTVDKEGVTISGTVGPGIGAGYTVTVGSQYVSGDPGNPGFTVTADLGAGGYGVRIQDKLAYDSFQSGENFSHAVAFGYGVGAGGSFGIFDVSITYTWKQIFDAFNDNGDRLCTTVTN